MIDAGSIALRQSPRPRAVVIAVCLFAGLAAAPAAHAQRIANGFDDAAARATQGPQGSSSGGPGGAAPINPMPHVPPAVSRPENWPGTKATNANAIDNHILSSIRANPGSPLEPLADDAPVVHAGGIQSEDGTNAAADGVVVAGFEDAGPAPPPPTPHHRTTPTRRNDDQVGLEGGEGGQDLVAPGAPPERGLRSKAGDADVDDAGALQRRHLPPCARQWRQQRGRQRE